MLYLLTIIKSIGLFGESHLRERHPFHFVFVDCHKEHIHKNEITFQVSLPVLLPTCKKNPCFI